jgi:minor extracellular serine protease Vpr
VAAYNTDPATILEINTIAFQAGETPDRIVAFSSRGPGVGNTLKPDIAAPGSNILAQGYTPGVAGMDVFTGFGQASGTSMASPHVAGAAALVRQAHPGWPNSWIKSALMSTSKYMDIYNFDETPAQPLDMGAGRLDLTNVADPGVILDPPSLSFSLVPTGTTKTVSVTVTSVASAAETYAVSTLYTGATASRRRPRCLGSPSIRRSSPCSPASPKCWRSPSTRRPARATATTRATSPWMARRTTPTCRPGHA